MDQTQWTAAGGKDLKAKWGEEDLSSAYLSVGDEPKYSFPTANAVSDDKDNNKITWTSREFCNKDKKTFFTMTLNAVCKPKAEGSAAAPAAKAVISAAGRIDACNW